MAPGAELPVTCVSLHGALVPRVCCQPRWPMPGLPSSPLGRGRDSSTKQAGARSGQRARAALLLLGPRPSLWVLPSAEKVALPLSLCPEVPIVPTVCV